MNGKYIFSIEIFKFKSKIKIGNQWKKFRSVYNFRRNLHFKSAIGTGEKTRKKSRRKFKNRHHYWNLLDKTQQILKKKTIVGSLIKEKEIS